MVGNVVDIVWLSQTCQQKVLEKFLEGVVITLKHPRGYPINNWTWHWSGNIGCWKKSLFILLMLSHRYNRRHRLSITYPYSSLGGLHQIQKIYGKSHFERNHMFSYGKVRCAFWKTFIVNFILRYEGVGIAIRQLKSMCVYEFDVTRFVSSFLCSRRVSTRGATIADIP